MRPVRTLVSLLLVPALVSVTTLTGLSVAPATAATCGSASGVSVVVDARAVGGALGTSCVSGGGEVARTLFERAGREMTWVNGYPGSAVCRVEGLPGDANCSRMPPEDAFWGLFWSDGKGGWRFASSGVAQQRVPAGGSVAWAWQTGASGYEYPGVAPPRHASSPSPSPSPSPSTGGSSGDSQGGNGPGGQQPSAPSTSPPSDAQGNPSASPTTGPTTGPSRRPARRDAAARGERSGAGTRDGAGRADGQRRGADRRLKEQRRAEHRDLGDRSGATAEALGDAAIDPAASSTDAGQEGRLPLWLTMSVLVGLGLLALLTVVLRRRAAR